MVISLVYAVCATAIMNFACDMLVVEGKLKKYCAATVAVISLALVATPMLGVIGKRDEEHQLIEIPKVSYQTIDISTYEELMKEVYMRNMKNSN